jgi:hypothetical protein
LLLAPESVACLLLQDWQKLVTMSPSLKAAIALAENVEPNGLVIMLLIQGPHF